MKRAARRSLTGVLRVKRRYKKTIYTERARLVVPNCAASPASASRSRFHPRPPWEFTGDVGLYVGYRVTRTCTIVAPWYILSRQSDGVEARVGTSVSILPHLNRGISSNVISQDICWRNSVTNILFLRNHIVLHYSDINIVNDNFITMIFYIFNKFERPEPVKRHRRFGSVSMHIKSGRFGAHDGKYHGPFRFSQPQTRSLWHSQHSDHGKPHLLRECRAPFTTESFSGISISCRGGSGVTKERGGIGSSEWISSYRSLRIREWILFRLSSIPQRENHPPARVCSS